MKRKLILVRHAQSENNAKPEFQRVADPGITALGHRQAHHLAEKLATFSPTRIFCSPFLRSLETAEYVCKRVSIPAHVRHDLFEEGGCYSGYLPGPVTPQKGMGRETIQRKFPTFSIESPISSQGWWLASNYESEEEVIERALRVSEWMAYDGSLENHISVLVIHADFKRRLLQAIFDRDAGRFHQETYNTSISELEFSANGWVLHSFNLVDHLPAECVS